MSASNCRGSRGSGLGSSARAPRPSTTHGAKHLANGAIVARPSPMSGFTSRRFLRRLGGGLSMLSVASAGAYVSAAMHPAAAQQKAPDSKPALAKGVAARRTRARPLGAGAARVSRQPPGVRGACKGRHASARVFARHCARSRSRVRAAAHHRPAARDGVLRVAPRRVRGRAQAAGLYGGQAVRA